MISREAWSPAGGLTLEPSAFNAATEGERSLALTAGPGAGKTEMLAQRADFLLRTGTCRYPKRILAISFKVDASKNLKERVKRRCGPQLASRLDSFTFHAFAKQIIDRFRMVLTGDKALSVKYEIGDRKIKGQQITFGDLIPLAVCILKRSKMARNAVRQTYSDVFLDEFQDCTDQQYELIKTALLHTSCRLTAVGDTKQRIMGWAGALEGIFETFASDFNAKSLNMYRNFRSQPRLLRMQNEIIRVLDPASEMPADSMAGDEGEIFIQSFDSESEEAEQLANTIAEWVGEESIPLSEVAVLVSRQLDLYASPLMDALERRGIPFRNEQDMQDIAVEPAARLIVDYLSCLYGIRNPDAWIRLTEQLAPYEDSDAQTAARQQFQQFLKDQRKSVQEQSNSTAPYRYWWRYVVAFLQFVGLETVTALSPDYEKKRRLLQVTGDTRKRIQKLLQIEPDLPTALQRFSDDQAVRILTFHKSKGLEFDSVILLAVENEIFFGDNEANRCAFFVGISRAKRRLMLTHTKTRQRPTGYSGGWSINRSPQEEYLGYAAKFLCESEPSQH